MSIKVLAPAKINLGLEILGKRKDGYHDVDMVMQSVNLYDVLRISISDGSLFVINSNEEFDCNLEDNTMYKAAKCFFEFVGLSNPGITIEIEKNIPSCAGLAGGSSDAAAVIVALDKMFHTGLLLNEMIKIGEEVGSDVPFCIVGGTARASGRGTVLNSVMSRLQYHVVIVKPDVNISTGSAYAKAENIREKNILAIDNITCALQNDDLLGVCHNLFNRFEDVVGSVEIFTLKNRMIRLGAKASIMTGSGSAVFGIFEDFLSAKKCYELISKDYKQSYLCNPVTHGAVILK